MYFNPLLCLKIYRTLADVSLSAVGRFRLSFSGGVNIQSFPSLWLGKNTVGGGKKKSTSFLVQALTNAETGFCRRSYAMSDRRLVGYASRASPRDDRVTRAEVSRWRFLTR